MASEREVSKKGDDDYVDFKKFCAVPKLDEFKWDLPENLARYANDHFNKFIPENDSHEGIWFSQAATKITRCYGTFIRGLEHS